MCQSVGVIFLDAVSELNAGSTFDWVLSGSSGLETIDLWTTRPVHYENGFQTTTACGVVSCIGENETTEGDWGVGRGGGAELR